jgi:hypothetical protein
VAFGSDVKEMGVLEDGGPEWDDGLLDTTAWSVADDDDNEGDSTYSETSGDEAGTSMGREKYSCSWCQ